MRVIIVESPSKAKKIQSYFPEYKIVSTCGHICDLSKNNLSIDIENNFKPRYQAINGKQKIIKHLKSYINRDILLGADDDREGDAIAWHCANTMRIDINENNRIKFNEISKKALEKAISNPEKLDMNSVNSQQARRIIDRLIGFSISPLLWKHIDTNVKGLSAGRVQSSLLYLLMNNEEDIKNEIIKNEKEINGVFDNIYNTKFMSNKKISYEEIFKNIKLSSRKFNLVYQKKSKVKRYPKSPFITSTLQRAAINELGYDVKTINNIAQKLYENGKITYIRTDSQNVSLEFQRYANVFICNKYNEDIFSRPKITNDVIGMQGAHECIRVINFDDKLKEDIFNDHDRRLYKLIYKNSMCAHMKPGIYERTEYIFSNNNLKNYGYFKGYRDILIYDGYLRYNNNVEIKEETQILEEKDYLLTHCDYKDIPNTPKSYPNESTIIKILEKTGIGRPSTYGSIIANIKNKNYTEIKNIKSYKISYNIQKLNEDNSISQEVCNKEIKEQKNVIMLTELGKKVLEYLISHFNHIINPKFTSLVEDDLDLISKGEVDWISVVNKVYISFIDIVNIQNRVIVKNKYYKRYLGKYNNKNVIILQGKYGYFIKYGNKNINIDRLLLDNNPDDIDIKDICSLL